MTEKDNQMKSITRKIRVSPEGWVNMQAPAELGDQEVDVIIIPRRAPVEERREELGIRNVQLGINAR